MYIGPQYLLLLVISHGNSPHSPHIDYFTMAADVLAFINKHSLSSVSAIGHSMVHFRMVHIIRYNNC